RAQDFPAGKYVDMHTHLTHRWGAKAPLEVTGLLGWMDAHDVAQAIVLPLISPEAWDHAISTDYVLEQTKDHRDRLVPFCSIDPRTIHLEAHQAKVDQLTKYRDAGAKGFGEHKPGVPIDHPGNIAVFKVCAELGLPILFHLDNHRNMDAPGLPGLEKVLREVPDGVFIGHAQGWWASISGDVKQDEMEGYPSGPVAPGGAMDRLMDAYPNLYGDLSAGSGANAISRDKEFGREFMIRRQDRLFFGTDYLAPDQDVPQFALFDKLDLPAEVQTKIFQDNARQMLHL
ncbi:MAG: amidohydrolase family protein, partial [Candidatus Hydrogenedentes bacterium]|nr:amidohydrolase family protein [Candidatus Hydrogenedentota bacterium]